MNSKEQQREAHVTPLQEAIERLQDHFHSMEKCAALFDDAESIAAYQKFKADMALVLSAMQSPPSHGASPGHEQLREAVSDDAIAKERAEWLHKHGAPKGWLIVTEHEVDVLKSELAALRARLEQVERALHQCHAATGEEAGDADDFRALLDREAITVEAVNEMRRELDAARKDSERLDALEYDANGNSVGYVCVHIPYKDGGSFPKFGPQGGKVRDVIDEAIAASTERTQGGGK